MHHTLPPGAPGAPRYMFVQNKFDFLCVQHNSLYRKISLFIEQIPDLINNSRTTIFLKPKQKIQNAAEKGNEIMFKLDG